MNSLKWFITGTSSGFGRQLTEILLARGDTVAATVRNFSSLDNLALQYPGHLWRASLDVTKNEDVHRVIDEAFLTLGRIDVVVSNAGYGTLGAAEEFTDEQVEQQIQTNLIGSIQVTRAALPHLRAQGGGRVIQIASMGGQTAFPGMSLYHATKWGIEGFFESVLQEVAPLGIQMTLIEPGMARTDFAGRSLVQSEPILAYEKTPVGAFRTASRKSQAFIPGDPEKMAHAIITLVDSGKAPHRLALGSDAYHRMHEALSTRLAELEAQKDVAYSTDADD